jgi:hypothetical protein
VETGVSDDLLQWANAHPDFAYVGGFLIIVAIFHVLYPFQIGLSCATSKDIPFKDVDVGRQVKKPHRFALASAALITFSFLLFAMSLPGLALIAGGSIMAALVASDYAQIYRENGQQA